LGINRISYLEDASKEIKHVNRSRAQIDENSLAPWRIVSAIPQGETLAYNSVLTTIRILEQKGYVEHRQEGRAFIYRPLIAEHEASRTEVKHILSRFFGNSREQLLLSLLGDSEISREELDRLKAAINSVSSDEAVGSQEVDEL
jgi:predicted transcriptional regulator